MPEDLQGASAGSDFIVSELLSELKNSNCRKDHLIDQLRKTICGIVIASFVIIAAIVGVFIWYLNQYDFSSTSTYEATGVYALIDSEGNVVASDLTEEEINMILEVLNTDGNSTEDSNQETN